MYQLERRINNQILGVKGSRREVLSIVSLPGGTRKFSHKLLRNVYSTSTSSRTTTETHCFMLNTCVKVKGVDFSLLFVSISAKEPFTSEDVLTFP